MCCHHRLIDGWHTFDHTLVDFFYVDLLLDIDGLIFFDDTEMPSTSRVISFIRENRAYEEMDVPLSNLAVFRKTAHDGRRWDEHRVF